MILILRSVWLDAFNLATAAGWIWAATHGGAPPWVCWSMAFLLFLAQGLRWTGRLFAPKPLAPPTFVADLRPEQNQILGPLLTELSKGMAPADQHEFVRIVAEEVEKKRAAQLESEQPAEKGDDK